MATYTKLIADSPLSFQNKVTNLGTGVVTLAAGDTIQLESGGTHDGFFSLRDINTDEIPGLSKDNPIYIDFNGTFLDLQNNAAWDGMNFNNCDHVHLIDSVGGGGIQNVATGKYCILGRAGSFIIDGLDISGGNQGIGIHNDAAVGLDYTLHRVDYASTGGVSNEYLEVRNCTIHDTNLEGIYLGASNTHRWYAMSTDLADAYEQPLVNNIIVEDNTVYNNGNEAIQVSALYSIVRDNYCYNFGTNGSNGHTHGVQAGSYRHTEVYRNFIDGYANSLAKGVYIFGSYSAVFNNIIKRCTDGISLTFEKQEANGGHQWTNNTLCDISRWGVVSYNGIAPFNRLQNNIIHLTAAETVGGDTTHRYFYQGGGSALAPSMVEADNIEVADVAGLASLDFDNYLYDDLRLGASSIALLAGVNLTNYTNKIRQITSSADAARILNYYSESRGSGDWNCGAV